MKLIAQRIPEAPLNSVAVWLLPGALGLLSTLLWFGGPEWVEALRYERAAVAAGAWWRLLTGNLVHLGGWHLFFNLLSLVLLVLLCPERARPSEWLVRVAFVATGMTISLYYFAPSIGNYVGLSGLIYGLFALGFARQAATGDWIAWGCLAFVAARIGWEVVVGAPASEEALIGGSVVGESHLYGAFAALLYGGLVAVAQRLRRPVKKNEQD